MKKKIYKYIILFLLFSLTACGVIIEDKKDTYTLEKVFDNNLQYEEAQVSWIIGTDYYALSGNKLKKYDLESGEITESFLRLGNRNALYGVRNYVDDEGTTYIVCKCQDKESEKENIYICKFDPSGELISEYDCTEIMKKVHFNPEIRSYFMGILPDGKILIYYRTEGLQYQMLLSEKAEIILEEQKEMEVEDCKICEDGQILLYTKKNGIFEMNVDTGEWKQVAEKCKDDGFIRFLQGTDNLDVYYYRTLEGIRKYDGKKNKIQKIVEFEELSLQLQNVGHIFRLPNEDIIILYVLKANESYNFYRMRKVKDGEEIVTKKEIILAFVGLKGIYDKEVYAYNASQDKVRVKIKVYEDVDSLIVDVMAGSIPDVIDIGDALIFQTMEKKGLLEDLKAYLEKDEQLSIDDFHEKALHFYEKGDRLYSIPYSMEIRGMMVNRKALGEKNTWSLKEFEEFIDSFPEPEKVTKGCTQNEIFYHLCMKYLNCFVDVDTSKCNFQSEEFLELMRCAKRFAPLAEDEEDYEGMREKIVDERILLTTLQMDSINFDYAFTRALFQKNGQLIGFPSDFGSGFFVIATPLAPAITSSGENKEEAWDFLKYVFTHERENFNYMDFLSYKPLYEEHLKKLYNAANEDIPIAQISENGYQIDVAPASLNEIDEIIKILKSGETLNPMNYQILDIIDEEAESYFLGSKTEEQVAEVIQNRVKLYISEE